MGECGCTSCDNRHTFPGPGKSFYLLTLAGKCPECDTPPGITIELIEPSNPLYEEYKRGDFVDGPLQFEKWGDGKGTAIITGMRRHEFVSAVKNHLIGLSAADFGENGKIDEIGAETIIEEMYDDSQVKPTLVCDVVGAKQ